MAARQYSQVPTGTSDGQKLCARQQWCSAQTRDAEGTWHSAPTYQSFCLADESKITQDVQALPAAYRRLAERIGDPVRSGRAIRVPPGSRVLVSPDIDALLRLMSPVLAGWAVRVRAIPQLSLTGNRHPHGSAKAVEEDCNVLTRHTTPLLALAPGPMARTWTWRAGSAMPADLEAEIADLKISYIGDGWVVAVTSLDGTDAGLEILDLHRRAVKLLGENPAPPELLDGIPCRSCEAMSSLEVLPTEHPDPEKPDPPFCRCTVPGCKDEMTRREYDAWTVQYGAWTRGVGVLTCRRCELGRCADCCFVACQCRSAGHRIAA